jgi:hypothetical protein
MRVFFGPATNPQQFPCALVPALTSTSTITCATQSGAQGTGFRFTVFVADQSVRGNDTVNFPVVPSIYSVTGCPLQSANGTAECSTEGGVLITITGKDFLQVGISVTVNGGYCLSPVVFDQNQGITCVLPPGVGINRGVIVTSNSQASLPAPLVSYGPACTAVLGSILCVF